MKKKRTQVWWYLFHCQRKGSSNLMSVLPPLVSFLFRTLLFCQFHICNGQMKAHDLISFEGSLAQYRGAWAFHENKHHQVSYGREGCMYRILLERMTTWFDLTHRWSPSSLSLDIFMRHTVDPSSIPSNFLRASKGNVEKASKRWAVSKQWREENDIGK